MICNHLHLQSDSLCLFSDMHCKIVWQIIPAKLKDDFLNKHRNSPLLAGKNSVGGGKFFFCLFMYNWAKTYNLLYLGDGSRLVLRCKWVHHIKPFMQLVSKLIEYDFHCYQGSWWWYTPPALDNTTLVGNIFLFPIYKTFVTENYSTQPKLLSIVKNYSKW